MNTLTNLSFNLQKGFEVGNLPDSPWFTLALFSLAAILLIVSGIKNKAILGIMLTVGLIIIAARLGQTSLAQMGFIPPENWRITVLLGVLIGSSLSFLSIIVIQPLFENIMKQPHDVSIVEGVRANWKSLLSWLVLIWTLVAFGEEVIFRGFLMSRGTDQRLRGLIWKKPLQPAGQQ